MVSLSSNITAQDIQYQVEHWDEDRHNVIIAATTTFFVLALFFVALRFLTKWIRKIKFHLEDHLILVTLIMACGLWIQALLNAKFGAGKHSIRILQEDGVEYLSKNLQEWANKLLFALELTYVLAHFALKISILFFYRTLFTFVVTPFKYAWYGIFAYVVANTVSAVIVILVQCQPLRYTWDQPKGIEGKCGDLTAIEIGNGVAIAVADLMLLVLPMPILWTLHVSRKEKVMLCGLFALGSVALTASIARVTYLGKVISSVDFTFIMVDALIWTILEVDLGIICACIPTIKPLFWGRKAQKSTTSSYPSNGNSSDKSRRRKNDSDLTKSGISLDEYPLNESQGPLGKSSLRVANDNGTPNEEMELNFITVRDV